MALQYGEHHKERISPEEFFALVESDPEHRYEYIDGYAYMMTGGTPDYSIIGANMNRILGEHLRKRPCIVYNSDVYIDTQIIRIQLYRRETDYWTMRNFTQDDTIELASLGIHFPVAEVYEKTTFDNTFTD